MKALTESEAKELMDLGPSTVFLICKVAIKNARKMDIYEIILYLNSQYSTDRKQIIHIQSIPSRGDVPSFEAISDDLKTLLKSMKEKNENTSLKNKFLLGGWISAAAKAYRHDKL